MSIKSTEQEIASFCFKEIPSSNKTQLADNNDKLSKFKSDIRRLPAMITNNGLLATMTFYKKNNDKVYNIINKWFSNKSGRDIDLIKYLTNLTYEELLFKTSEALKLADWLKRIVEVKIKDDKTTQEE
ncbi:type III-B CRISPR module-associated protein Cmr5 [Caldicellulosiruptor morganii]|uniref:CRISPR type III-B/RAMP module-associated protein Cmr5 n=1 Tax=Caldicellulosiruptor morganii TaxID=1387555 RepID=A0ABY7BLL1_9FIRM|nr:type III-B CRISPR module-associated protein Cmr5 [Caldicellulosiruptor morganii]WAM33728.1 type III-B CRISPR module-associated protein Cmr5 [Caldicellulosiruptor morganii]